MNRIVSHDGSPGEWHIYNQAYTVMECVCMCTLQLQETKWRCMQDIYKDISNVQVDLIEEDKCVDFIMSVCDQIWHMGPKSEAFSCDIVTSGSDLDV